jgi:hypothetical protein
MVRYNAATASGVDRPHKTDPVESELDVPSQQSTAGQNHGETTATEKDTPAAVTKILLSSEKTVRARKYVGRSRSSVKEHLLKESGSRIQSKISKALQAQEKVKARALRNSLVRRLYQTERRERTQSLMPDWRVILAQLRKYTSQNGEWLEEAVCILVPDSAAEKLFNSVDDNMWDITERYGSSVRLANRKSDMGQYNEFILSGPATAISKTAAEVVRIAPDSKVKAGPQALLSEGSPTTSSPASVDSESDLTRDVTPRLVRSERARTIPATRPENLPRPSEWTTHTFADYVTDLTSIKMPNHLHKLWYKKEEDHIKVVVGVLREIFSSPDCRSSLSRTAFNKAIANYVKMAHISDARAAFVLMEMMEVPMNPETFNIMLRGAAKQEDLHVFQLILRLMLRRGVMPNGGTWIAFLMANYNFGIKSHIVSAMKERGLLSHTPTLKGVCEQLISQEISASLDQAQSQEDFLHHMDASYGERWLTIDSGNRVLHALGARHLISRCWEFLQAMDARHIKPDQVSINTILNHCKQSQNIIGAIEIMACLPSLFHFVPDEHTYHALFELAWRSRSYNLVRVVWKYACLNAATTRRMRLRVRQSWLNAAEDSSTHSLQHDVWKLQAGPIITCNVHDHPTAHFPELHIEEPLIGLELDPSRASRKKIQLRGAVDKLLERDCQIFRHWAPTRPFGEMLMEAWERDCKWQEVRRDTGGTILGWKLERAIAVPLHSRRRHDPLVLEWK